LINSQIATYHSAGNLVGMCTRYCVRDQILYIGFSWNQKNSDSQPKTTDLKAIRSNLFKNFISLGMAAENTDKNKIINYWIESSDEDFQTMDI
jgi:hypothetical protein